VLLVAILAGKRVALTVAGATRSQAEEAAGTVLEDVRNDLNKVERLDEIYLRLTETKELADGVDRKDFVPLLLVGRFREVVPEDLRHERHDLEDGVLVENGDTI
jgi:hypothetical protein